MQIVYGDNYLRGYEDNGNCRVEWWTMWVFPKIMVPPNHQFSIGFSIINHPFSGTPIFGNTLVRTVHGKYNIPKRKVAWIQQVHPKNANQSLSLKIYLTYNRQHQQHHHHQLAKHHHHHHQHYHQTHFTPSNFYTRHLLHQKPLAPNTFSTRQLLHQPPFTPDIFYTRHLLHQTSFTPDTFYTKHLLHQTTFTPNNFYTKHLLHQTPFTPNTFYKQLFH